MSRYGYSLNRESLSMAYMPQVPMVRVASYWKGTVITWVGPSCQGE